MNNHPKWTGKPATSLTTRALTGCIFAWDGNGPVTFRMPGSPREYLACFRTPDRLKAFAAESKVYPLSFTMKQIMDGNEFMESVAENKDPPIIILEPQYLSNDRMRFTQVMLDES